MNSDEWAWIVFVFGVLITVSLGVYMIALIIRDSAHREGACYQACHSHAVVLKNVPDIGAHSHGYVLCECDKPEGKLLKLVMER